jgi:hypothetical protein
VGGGAWNVGNKIHIENDGNHTIEFYSTDSAGNVETTKTTYAALDTTPPFLSVSSPQNTTYGSDEVPLTFETSDESSGLFTTFYNLDNAGNVTSGNTTLNVSDGGHTIVVYVNDTVGHLSQRRITFTINTSVPSIIFVAPTPSNDFNRSKNYVYINISTQSAVVDMDTAILDFNGTLYWMNKAGTGNNVNFWFNATPLSEGLYDYTVNANDTSGNLGTSEIRRVIIDLTSPSTDDDAPNGWQSSHFNVNLSCVDNLSGCASTTYSVNSTGWTAGGTIRITIDGNHTIEFYSTDRAGNVETVKTIYAALDTTPPFLSVSSPQNTTYGSDEVPLTFEASQCIRRRPYYSCLCQRHRRTSIPTTNHIHR